MPSSPQDDLRSYFVMMMPPKDTLILDDDVGIVFSLTPPPDSMQRYMMPPVPVALTRIDALREKIKHMNG
jgi:hypothetical protein